MERRQEKHQVITKSEEPDPEDEEQVSRFHTCQSFLFVQGEVQNDSVLGTS